MESVLFIAVLKIAVKTSIKTTHINLISCLNEHLFHRWLADNISLVFLCISSIKLFFGVYEDKLY